jgi:hypothetical protein
MQARRRLEAAGDRSTQVYGAKRRGRLQTEPNSFKGVGTRVVKTLRVLTLKPHHPNTRLLKRLVFRSNAVRGEILEYFTSEPRRSNAGLEEPKTRAFFLKGSSSARRRSKLLETQALASKSTRNQSAPAVDQALHTQKLLFGGR